MKTKLIFGFGSLINTSSLRITAPDASDIRPAYVKGFRRDFSVWAPEGSRHLEPADIPFCALDIQEDSNPDAKINGVVFTVNDDGFALLKERECEYELVETVVYDFKSDELLGKCWVFSSCKNNGSYDLTSPAQIQYLKICLEGCRQYDENFYQMFLDTTFIGDKHLSDMPELLT